LNPLTHDPRAIANLLISLAKERQIGVSNGKLQKLLFLAHAISLVTKSKPLVHSSFEAWQYGPVSREAYEAFKSCGAGPITKLATKRNPATGAETEIAAPLDVEVCDLAARVVVHYGPWEFSRLVELTHAKHGPWDFVVQSAASNANLGLRISDQVIRDRCKFLWKVIDEEKHGAWPEENRPFA
jgi:uncharacterized phage-associated protein